MGFGYLLIGYLVTFVLYLTVQAIGVGGLALLLGYGLMLRGLWDLTHYQRAFAYAKWSLLPLLITALYETLVSFNTLFYWDIPFLTPTLDTVMDDISFFLLIFFNLAMLFGIRMIAKDLELVHIATKAVRNSIFVAMYGVLYLAIGMFPEKFAIYATVAVSLLNLVWIIFNLFLLLSCNKNICRAEDEDQAPKRSRFEIINRIGDAYDRNRQQTIDSTREYAEDVLRRRKEARENKNTQHKKRKRKK